MEKINSFLHYFSNNRNDFEDFYTTEKIIIDRIFSNEKINKVLDIGCACGGLYNALKNKYGEISYTGIEINDAAAKIAKNKYPEVSIINSDFNEFQLYNLEKFNVVFSLSCFDWNLGITNDILLSFYNMLNSSWDFVEEGGYLILSLRLDENETIFDSKISCQYINYEDKLEGEIANYGILSINDFISIIKKLQPSKVLANGFIGKPSKTAITPKNELCFSVFAIQKPKKNQKITEIELNIDISEKFNLFFNKINNK
jgi:trans-aconitate methyltransferase